MTTTQPPAKPLPQKWSDFSPYLKGELLGAKLYTLTIREIKIVTTHPNGLATETPVCYFDETGKGLILTPTNRAALKELFGDAIRACIGQKISIGARRTTVAGKVCYPIYIEAVQPSSKPPATKPPAEKEKAQDGQA